MADYLGNAILRT